MDSVSLDSCLAASSEIILSSLVFTVALSASEQEFWGSFHPR
jgi:hypothetical protein